ncbi:hypothetical protein T08_16431 [Trichinella sp. T8]|nr:hypothetical protein T08_16431 [Trichinella sp. T8]
MGVHIFNNIKLMRYLVSDCHIYKYKEPHIFSFFTISREIRNRGTWDQAHCCFLIFSYILTLFLEKNRIFENFEMSWAIDCCFHVLDEKCFFSILKSFFGYVIVAPINGLKLNIIISMLTFLEICYKFYSTHINQILYTNHCHDLETNATKEWHVGNIIPLLKVIIKSNALHRRVPIFVFMLT